ncbi:MULTISPECIES: HNH endonuclease [Bacillaceae]|uniref:HNH endonuclease n=1 Tax=Evansella alkalicola TaxID=745819 RepID=A0ABS6JS04_9BACI|nr:MULTISPECIES: HNH endonuclease [Bacillaceae]MBU9721340.1 HNH endonuclease [Bacillus alkalicola]
MEFRAKGGGKGKRRGYCLECTPFREEHKVEDILFSYDSSILSDSEQIYIKGKTSSGKRYKSAIDYDVACILVNEGNVRVVHEKLILNLFNRKTFREFIFNRDNYTCHYCGEFGNTIDHVLPRSKGGKKTVKNCVCACFVCNRNKGYKDYENFIEKGLCK